MPPSVRIVDVTDPASFELIPPCADPAFDHRTCDYWEDADRGSKAHRASWLEAGSPPPAAPASLAGNPFAPPPREPPDNPFLRESTRAAFNPFDPDQSGELDDNPFAPKRAGRSAAATQGPRKLGLLGRGMAIFGSYSKVLLLDDLPAVYAQFGPLSAYPRALRLRELYRQLPDAPLPAVITCIATTSAARHGGLAARLIEAVCDDLAARGFAAVEAYPEAGTREDATSAASPGFWRTLGFALAVDDARYPVVRRELV